jgi:hypothetical protein
MIVPIKSKVEDHIHYVQTERSSETLFELYEIISYMCDVYRSFVPEQIVLSSHPRQGRFCAFVSSPIDDDDQRRYSPDRALDSLAGFMMVCSTMWGYQLHDRPVLDILIQPSETSSSNYQRLSWRSRETRVRNGRWFFCRRATIVLVGFFYVP